MNGLVRNTDHMIVSQLAPPTMHTLQFIIIKTDSQLQRLCLHLMHVIYKTLNHIVAQGLTHETLRSAVYGYVCTWESKVFEIIGLVGVCAQQMFIMILRMIKIFMFIT